MNKKINKLQKDIVKIISNSTKSILVTNKIIEIINSIKERKCEWKDDIGKNSMFYKYIYFEQYSLNWHCKNIKSKEILGTCYFHEKWEEWVFEGLEFSFFNNSCLLDITDFLNRLNNALGKKELELAKPIARAIERYKGE